ncbi:unnamed protein product [Notodromas monacha]|uniref:RanBP2-type domain-containing protein n=1 Tax=Notodromas monacha TaxID=399045 RepID=A0A7R9BZ80_9CRUS|nr:unnamed protein product [Notodromas monacha]CAG0923266.1 unnamed protein product [Notodromas monacha]
MSKRQKILEESLWECTVCTYRNKAEAFKCLMCDTRKGTSTRKPRLNPQVAAQLFNPSSSQPVKPKKEAVNQSPAASSLSPTPTPVQNGTTAKELRKPREPEKRITAKGARGRWKNIDRTSGRKREVTVNNVTVVFTEFQPKVKRSPSSDVSDKSITPSPGRKAANGLHNLRGGINSSNLSSHSSSRREASHTSSGDSRSSS